jgi:hypothetical protein
MSMKWMRGLNHNLQHDASKSKKPSELPTIYTTSPPLPTAHIRLEMYPYDQWPQLNVLTHFIYSKVDLLWVNMKWMRGLNHNLQRDASKKPSELPTTTSPPLPRAHIRRELHPYDQWPQLKMLKSLYYIYNVGLLYEYEVNEGPQS